MALMKKGSKAADGDNNIFWTTMSDLLLGLAIIFMTLFVLAMTGFTQESIEMKKNQLEASKEIIEKLKQENIQAEVDELTGDIKISDLELFEVNSYNLSQKGKNYLNKLVPIYINTVFSKPELIEGIESVIVQGHTDSQSYAGLSTKEEQFMRNMTLSLQRANSVAEYMFKTGFDKKYSSKLQSMIIVEGKSFSEPVMTPDGKEDFAKSRRVELRLKVKNTDLADDFFKGVQHYNINNI